MPSTLQERLAESLARLRNPRTGADLFSTQQVRDIATTTSGRVRLTLLLAEGDDPALAKEVRKRHLPHAVLLHADGGEGQAFLARKNEALGAMKPVNGKAAAYVCVKRACKAPVTSAEALGKLLDPPTKG